MKFVIPFILGNGHLTFIEKNNNLTPQFSKRNLLEQITNFSCLKENKFWLKS